MAKTAAHLVSILIVALFACFANADITITSEIVETSPGVTVQVDFFAADPDGSGCLTGFNLPIDIGVGTDGDLIPGQLTLLTPFVTNAFGANVSYSSFAGLGFNFDGVVNVAQPPPLELTSSPQLVFSLNFEVSNAAADGDVYDITIVTDGAVASGLLDITGVNIGDENTAVFGAAQIVVVAGLIGDVNCDGNVNLLDVGPFIDLIASGGYSFKADINGDGSVNLLDVNPFIDILGGG